MLSSPSPARPPLDRRLEVVHVSELDRRIYLRWHAADGCPQMVALPFHLSGADQAELRSWVERTQLPLAPGEELGLGRLLRQRLN